MSNNKMLIDASHPEETRVAIVRGSRVDEFDFESEHKKQIRGNIYLAKVTRVEPSLQAAFVDYGGNRHGFLAFSEIHPDYYQIPVADREALLAAEAEDALRAAQDDSDDDDEDAAEAEDNGDEENSEEAPVSAKPKRRRRSRRRGAKSDAAAEEVTEAEDGTDEAAAAKDDSEPAAEEASADSSGDDAGEESDESDDLIAAENDGDDVVSEPVSTESGEAKVEKPKKPRATRRKSPAKKTAAETKEASEEAPDTEASGAPEADVEAAPAKPKRRRTSRKKADVEAAEQDTTSEAPAETVAEPATSEEPVEADASEETKPKRRRARRKSTAKKDQDTESKASEDAAEPTDVETKTTDDDSPAEESEAAPENGRKRRRRTRGRGRNRDGDADTANDDDETNGTPVESVGADDALEEVPTRRTSRRHYKIQEVIKRRQILLVQVVKEERGNKGAALTTYLSLAGRYSVLMPNTARGGGISRKITNMSDRKRMKATAGALDVPKGMGVILRTAGASQTPQEIQRDFEYLLRLWENVRTLTLESTAPCLVYEEGSLIKRSIRDLYHKDTGEVLVSGEQGFKEARDFMAMLMPGHEKSVRQYKERVPLFSRMGVEDQLDAMLQPQVTLKSGGYLIIDQTEALVAIDVNSGRSTRQHSVEDTATQTNLEAADEVARQLRLRDLAGLIVIDFIDMDDRRNVRAVEKRLKDALKNDRARIQVGRISHFGLMEMSRQRIRASVLESTTQTCPTCGGVGYVKSGSSVALSVLRAIEEQLNRNARNNLNVRVTTPTALYMLNTKRDNLSDLESRFGVLISIEADDSLGTTPCVIERGEQANRRPVSEGPVQVDTVDPDRSSETAEAVPTETSKASDEDQAPSARSGNGNADDAEGENRPKRRRRRRKQRSDSDEASETAASEQADEQTQDQTGAVIADEAEAAAPDAAVGGDEEEEAKARKTPRKRTSRPRKPKSEEPAVAAQDLEPEVAVILHETEEPAVKAEDRPAEPPRPPRRNTRRVAASASAESADTTVGETAIPEAVTQTAPQASEQSTNTDAKTDESDKKGWWQRKFF